MKIDETLRICVVKEEEMATECMHIYVIMDPTEKSETSRRDASTKDGRVRKYSRVQVYAWKERGERVCVEDHLLMMSYFVPTAPRRLPFNDYKRVRDTCNAFIHYHLPFSRQTTRSVAQLINPTFSPER